VFFNKELIMDFATIKAAIVTGAFTAEQVTELNDALKFARSRVAAGIIRKLTIGARVQFTGRGGRLEQGTVKSIGPKNVVVATPTVNWRVSASLLEVI
jgi:hypothetical protein